MSPFEHGEVFVLDDGGEVNKDFFFFSFEIQWKVEIVCESFAVTCHKLLYESTHDVLSPALFIFSFYCISAAKTFCNLFSSEVLDCHFYSLFCWWKVDLDLGNYERFLDIKLTRDNNITTGKIYQVSTLPLYGFFFTFQQVCLMFLIVLFWMFIVCY